MSFTNVYHGRRVLVTGHTGFKGSWLSEWLLNLGAEVTGFALPSPTSPALFEQLDHVHRLDHHQGDIRDLATVQNVVRKAQPEFVFHLAAQPLVRLSYEIPVETYATNIMGTAHILESIRQLDSTCTVVAVTTDKCYENREWVNSYREEDPMGGYDPYSSSKGAAELLINAYRRSYFSRADSKINLASARAGNVIGGGDWATDRIVPDCIRALRDQKKISVRNRFATRPWQHVLEPLSGYLWLAAKMSLSPDTNLRAPFNFGPRLESNQSVGALVEEALRHWPGGWEDQTNSDAVHEANLLNLATDKAFHFLNWAPVWDFSRTIEHTITWYRQSFQKTGREGELTREQIIQYEADAQNLNLAWTQ